jgi:hypothetical protein
VAVEHRPLAERPPEPDFDTLRDGDGQAALRLIACRGTEILAAARRYAATPEDTEEDPTKRRASMVQMSDRRADQRSGAVPAPAADEARLASMRRVKQMPVAERIALLDRLCREGTRIALSARRVR